MDDICSLTNKEDNKNELKVSRLKEGVKFRNKIVKRGIKEYRDFFT
jgi:hypothetical protein